MENEKCILYNMPSERSYHKVGYISGKATGLCLRNN
jgi:hypothetical protein